MSYKRTIPLYTLEGVSNAEITTHYMTTADNIGISMLRFLKKPSQDVVVVIHGLTTSSDMFIMPEHDNLVSWLHEQGYTDVFTLDYRMSNRHAYNLRQHSYTLDDCALFDHPLAIQNVRDLVGPEARIHVICHCLGAVSFMMSLFSQKVKVSSVIANSVALTPRIPTWSFIKISCAPFLIENIFGMPYVNPGWADSPRLTLGKIINKLVDLFHHECDNSACHMLSFMWGSGWPALYEHKNLADVTHSRGQDLYGGTSLNYHRHIFKMVCQKNTAVKMYPKDKIYESLPDNYFQYATEIDTPVLFMTGRNNRVFTDSNIECYNRLRKIAPNNRHELMIIEGYGHQDPFMGKNVAHDVFPKFLPFLKKHSASP